MRVTAPDTRFDEKDLKIHLLICKKLKILINLNEEESFKLQSFPKLTRKIYIF